MRRFSGLFLKPNLIDFNKHKTRTDVSIKIDDLCTQKIKKEVINREINNKYFEKTLKNIQEIVSKIEVQKLSSSTKRSLKRTKSTLTITRKFSTNSSRNGKLPGIRAPKSRGPISRIKSSVTAISPKNSRQNKPPSLLLDTENEELDTESLKRKLEKEIKEESEKLDKQQGIPQTDSFDRYTLPEIDVKKIIAPKGKLCLVYEKIITKDLYRKNYKIAKKSFSIHHRIVKKQLKSCDGYEVTGFLDKYLYAFPTILHALEFCLRVQTKLLEGDWPISLLKYPEAKIEKDQDGRVVFRGLRVKLAVHFGKTEVSWNSKTKREEVTGTVVDICQKLLDRGKTGEIVVSELIYSFIRSKLNFFTVKSKIAAREVVSEEKYVLIVYPSRLFYRSVLTNDNIWYLEEDEDSKMSNDDFSTKFYNLIDLSTNYSKMKSIEKLEKLPKIADEMVFNKLKNELNSFLRVSTKDMKEEVKDFLDELYATPPTVEERIETQKKKKKKKRKKKSSAEGKGKKKKKKKKKKKTEERVDVVRMYNVEVMTDPFSFHSSGTVKEKGVNTGGKGRKKVECASQTSVEDVKIVSKSVFELMENEIVEVKKEREKIEKEFELYKKDAEKRIEEFRKLNEVQMRIIEPLMSNNGK